MIKKILILGLIVVVIVPIGIFVFEKFNKPKASSQLSDRSKRFIEQQKTSGNNAYAPLNKKEGEDYKGDRVWVGKCFSFIMPYSVFNSRQEGECSGYFAFNNPKGSIVAYMEKAVDDSLDSAPGLSMRRMYPEKYDERVIRAGDREFLVFEDKTDIYTITMYHNTSQYYFIMTLNIPRKNEADLINILSSLEFN